MREAENLLRWSEQFSHLPWRGQRSLYHTLVSEFMLQQTTVATVINKFNNFIQCYPNIKALANTTEKEILLAWQGLGYYRRAKNLRLAAQYIVKHHDGEITCDYSQLIKIPGIGPYTASAVLSIGANQRYLAIDTNIERVLARYYGLDVPKGQKLKNVIQEQFDGKKILSSIISYRELNEALMDLGREVCQTNKVHCSDCPLKYSCRTTSDPQARPMVDITKNNKSNNKFGLDLLRVIIIDEDKLWAYQKNKAEWLTGQWECPTYIISSEDPNIKQYLSIDFDTGKLKSYKTSITKYKITNYILSMSYNDFIIKFNWSRPLVQLTMNNQNHFSTATLKALEKHSKT